MASEVDICNLALSHLGDSAGISSITPGEGSEQASHCARFYPIARDVALESHSWGFITRRATLAALDTDTWHWTYAYGIPSGMLRALAVLPTTASTDSKSEDFALEGTSTGARVILTNLDDATLRYTVKITDTTKFSPLFIDALSRLLASYLAGPIIKGDAGIAIGRARLAEFRAILAEAKVSDANQRKVAPVHSVPWIAVRS